MNITSLLGSMVNPKIIINTVRKQLEKNTGKKVNDFSICLVLKEKKELKFIINGEVWEFQDRTNIVKLIEAQATKKIKEGQTLDFLRLDIISDEFKGTLFFTENNEKKFLHFNTL
jgi:hypothetical protein